MAGQNYAEAAEFIRNNVRLKTLPLAVKFLKEKTFPERRGSRRWRWERGWPSARR